LPRVPAGDDADLRPAVLAMSDRASGGGDIGAVAALQHVSQLRRAAMSRTERKYCYRAILGSN
jgi:hypothetical protein